jgi:hypothetical protein
MATVPTFTVLNNITGSITSSRTVNNFAVNTKISLSKEEHAELVDDSLLLYALMDAGVEDWPGFQEALAIYRERKG